MDAQGYDFAWERQWGDMKRYGPYSRHVRRWQHKLMTPLAFSSVLDVGCGQGDALLEIKARYPHVQRVAGVDLSPVSIERARALVGEGRFEVLNVETDVLDETFDLVICADVVEHIHDDERVLANICKMTRGYALVSSIQGNSLPAWEAREVGHVRNYRRGELAAKMQRAGFEILNVVEWGFPFYSPLYRMVLTMTGGQGTGGSYGWGRKLLAQFLYGLFFLNSSKSGALIFVLAKPR
jgi:2-polyprenyl-3-methyl-5-hydroxy-6-metoxy-1,4-benzoquinol methylase